MNDELARRTWLTPAVSGVVGGIDLSLLDPADESDRHFLILAEHPDLSAAIDDDQDEIEIEGVPMSPRLHLAMHDVVANQVWNNDPPEVWSTAQRLTQAGYDRHEVLHMLASVVSTDIYNAMSGKLPFDIARTPSRTCRLARQLGGHAHSRPAESRGPASPRQETPALTQGRHVGGKTARSITGISAAPA